MAKTWKLDGDLFWYDGERLGCVPARWRDMLDLECQEQVVAARARMVDDFELHPFLAAGPREESSGILYQAPGSVNVAPTARGGIA